MPASRASVRVLTIFGIVIIGLLVVLLISNSSKAQSQQITRPNYEYKFFMIGGAYLNNYDELARSITILNGAATGGWQIVGTFRENRYGDQVFIFMREAEPPTTGDSGEGGNSGLVGDLDNDGDVDFADFLVLRWKLWKDSNRLVFPRNYKKQKFADLPWSPFFGKKNIGEKVRRFGKKKGKTANMYYVCGNGRRPLGLAACGLLPQHTERGTVLQTAARSVHNVKFHYHKIKWHFPIGCNRKEELMRKQITTFAVIAIALLIYPLSLSSQNSFSLSLDANGASGKQAATTLNASADQVVSIQIFGTNTQNARSLSARFEYDESQVVYEGFDAGNVLSSPQIFPEQGTNPTYVEIGMGALGGQATVNSGLVGTIRFRTTAAFSGTAIRLVRGVIGRSGQLETVTLTARVELQAGSVATTPSPDFDGDGVVGIPDFLLFVDQFGSSQGDGTYQERYDLDSNGVIGIPDFLILVDNFGKKVPAAGGGGGGGGSGSPDLIVESPSVSDDTLTPGQSFTLRATVRNQGNGQSAATTLRYYRSTNATINTSDASVGTDAVGSLSTSGTSSESIGLTAPDTPGTYYYGACVESAIGESDTGNNCSSGVGITVAGGNTFDQTVAQIKNLETKLEQDRNRIEQEITQQRQNHPLNAPKDQFETDEEYAARQSQLNAILAESRQRLLVSYGIKNTQTQIAQLYRKTFPTNDITVTLGTYNANSEYFPITFEATLNGEDRRYEQRLTLNRDDARSLYNNWNKVIAKGYLSIDPGYRQALVWVELKYTPIWPQGFWWERNEVYDLGDDNYAVAFSPDGKYIATGGNGENTSIWEVSSGRELRQTTHSGTVYAVTFSPDGQYLATGDATYVSLWQLSNNKLLWSKYQFYSNFGQF